MANRRRRKQFVIELSEREHEAIRKGAERRSITMKSLWALICKVDLDRLMEEQVRARDEWDDEDFQCTPLRHEEGKVLR